MKSSKWYLFKKYLLTSRPAQGPEPQNEFESYTEPVDIEKYREDLYQYRDKFRIVTSTSIRNQEKQYPIYQIEIGDAENSPKLLILAGVHGNECAGVLAIHELLHEISSNPQHYCDWCIRIITPVNPVGLAFQSRYNEDGYDINRDFRTFKTVGARLQREAVLNFKPDMIISFHEGPHEGFFVHLAEGIPRSVGITIVESLRAEGISLAQKNFLGILLRTEGLWQKGFWMRTEHTLIRAVF